MKKFEIAYIDGHDLKYKTFTTTAQDEENALKNLWNNYKSGDFDHQIINVKEI